MKRKIKKWPLFIPIALTAFLFFCYMNNNKESDELSIKLEQPEFFLSERPNIKLVMEACEYYGLHETGIVVSQAILETGHFRSENCIRNHNLFGLYNSKKGRYYKFSHWTESVVAYRDKIQYKKKPNEKYYDFLQRIGYAEDDDYIFKVKNIKKRFKL